MMTTRFVTIAQTADIKPGELAAFEVEEGMRIAVANAAGRFFAIDDTCTHEQCSLAAEGTLEGTGEQLEDRSSPRFTAIMASKRSSRTS
jgi:nitrite reductase/ring-hydroxylating ferredoxin subunit